MIQKLRDTLTVRPTEPNVAPVSPEQDVAQVVRADRLAARSRELDTTRLGEFKNFLGGVIFGGSYGERHNAVLDYRDEALNLSRNYMEANLPELQRQAQQEAEADGKTIDAPEAGLFAVAQNVREKNAESEQYGTAIGLSESLTAAVGPYLHKPESLDYPLPTQEHLASLHVLTDEFAASGDFLPETADLMHEFVERHDAGYAVDVEALFGDPASAKIVSRLAEAIDSGAQASEIADYLVNNKANYLASTVIGHGLTGLVANVKHYTEQGMDENRAFGLSVLFAAHHPGFPIDMVSGFLKGTPAEVPQNLRAALLIDRAGGDPEGLRAQLTHIGAEALDISLEEAAKIVSLGYGLDRITAGRAPESITINSSPVVVNDVERYASIHGGEVIQKKYGLVAGDLARSEPSSTLKDLYETVLERTVDEDYSAVRAAEQLNQPAIANLLRDKAMLVIGKTWRRQREALEAIGSKPVSLNLPDLLQARSRLLKTAGKTAERGAAYAIATLDVLIAAKSAAKK